MTERRFNGRVIKVTDGDTVKIAGWHEEVVSTHEVNGVTTELVSRSKWDASYRLIIVDAPERGDEPGYTQAKAFVQTLLPVGSSVTFITHGVDDAGWGRTLADVFPDDMKESVTQTLLRYGFAKVWAPR